MNVIMRTYSSNAECSGGCDYALLRLSKNLLAKIQTRCKVAESLYRKDTDLASLEYIDQSVRYFSWFDRLVDLLDIDAVDGGAPTFVGDDILATIPESLYEATESETVVILPDGVDWKPAVYWRCRPKQSDILIETATLGLEELLQKCET